MGELEKINALEQILTQGARALDISLNTQQTRALLDYLALIQKWNKTYNLSAIRTSADGVRLHLLDSLSVVAFMRAEPLLDIGAGAGLPGIVIAILRPDLRVTVLDSAGKKCRFMQFVKAELKLTNVHVVHQRIEDYHPEQCFQQIITRAFSSAQNTLKLAQHLASERATYWLMKGNNFTQETLDDLNLIKAHKLSVPQVSSERYLLEIRNTQ